MDVIKEPKVFISYSWSNQDHQKRVKHWADRLRADGVDVVLDIYDLKAGEDKNAFMERMSTDSTVTHVLVICDRMYAEKADARKAGVGAESQIISNEIYNKAEQSKFIPIICEFSDDGEAILPIFMKSKMWIDFSSSEATDKNWVKLIHRLYEKPQYVKPKKGEAPSYITNNTPVPDSETFAKINSLKEAAEQGDALAQANLGWMYKEGKGVEQNYEEAVLWFRKAAEQEETFAHNNLGNMYREGKGVEQNYEEAVSWYRKAAEQGETFAQNNLGNMYREGKGVEQNYEEAVLWLRKAAEQGNAFAQTNLGWMYREGKGVEQNYEEEVNWYRKAAEQGETFAQNNLGGMYEEGKGVKQNYEEAVSWYKKSAEQKNTAAQANLGRMYENGYGIEKNYVIAHKWYNISSSLGFEKATERKEMIEKKMQPSEIKKAEELAKEYLSTNIE